MPKIGQQITLTEELWLSMRAGARAIEKNSKLYGASYVYHPFDKDHKSILYYKAADVLKNIAREED
jgi:hypothetical protein